jgi:DNA-binding CsgD family transcriptional regulator
VAVRALGWILNQHDEFYRSLLAAQHALNLANDIDDARNRVASIILSGIGGKRVGYLDESMEWFTTALHEMDQCTDEAWVPVTRCIVLNQLGALHVEQGAIDQAERWYAESLATQQSLGLRFTPGGHAIKGLGEVAQARGDPQLALSHYLTSLQYAREVRDVRAIARSLGAIAGTLAQLGLYKSAARLFGASEAHHESIGYPFVIETFAIQRALGLPEPWSSMYPECTMADGLRRSQWERTAAIRAVRLDPDQAQAWWNEGRSLTLDAAIALIPTVEPAPVPDTEHPGGLSPREMEVLGLLAQGHTDRKIAELLFISPRTVQNHVQRIYARIDVSSRSAATRWAMDHHIA